jgi:hypothetical protein
MNAGGRRRPSFEFVVHEGGGFPDRNGAGTAAAVQTAVAAPQQNSGAARSMAVSADALSFRVEANSVRLSCGAVVFESPGAQAGLSA